MLPKQYNIFRKHTFTYFLYSLFDTLNFSKGINGQFHSESTKKQRKKTAIYYLYSQTKYSGDFHFFCFLLLPKMAAAPKNGMEKRLLFTVLHSLNHCESIPLERLKIGDSCFPNNKYEKSCKEAFIHCLSQPRWAIWFLRNKMQQNWQQLQPKFHLNPNEPLYKNASLSQLIL